MRPGVRSDLEPDVARALEGLGVEVVAVLPITALPQPDRQRATHRVVLADGRLLKARWVRRPRRAARMAGLLRTLGDPHFPAPLWVSGRVVLESWVYGTPLSELSATEHRIIAAAELLTRVHGLRRLGHRRLPALGRPGRTLVLARRHLGRLAGAGLVERRAAAALVHVLRRAAPYQALIGLTHQDFCATNLVEDTEGRIVAVDNEGIRLGFLDYDLARTWSRWPMPAPTWQTFVAAYRRASGRQVPAESWPFWQVCALARSAHYRLARRAPDLEVPLVALRDLARDP